MVLRSEMLARPARKHTGPPSAAQDLLELQNDYHIYDLSECSIWGMLDTLSLFSSSIGTDISPRLNYFEIKEWQLRYFINLFLFYLVAFITKADQPKNMGFLIFYFLFYCSHLLEQSDVVSRVGVAHRLQVRV